MSSVGVCVIDVVSLRQISSQEIGSCIDTSLLTSRPAYCEQVVGNARVFNIPGCKVVPTRCKVVSFSQIHAKGERFTSAGTRQIQRLVVDVVNRRNPRRDEFERSTRRVSMTLELVVEVLPACVRARLWIPAILTRQLQTTKPKLGRTSRVEGYMQPGQRYIYRVFPLGCQTAKARQNTATQVRNDAAG